MGLKDKKAQFEGDEEEEVIVCLYRLTSKNKLSKRLSSFQLSEKRFKLSPSMVTSFKREILIKNLPSSRKR